MVYCSLGHHFRERQYDPKDFVGYPPERVCVIVGDGARDMLPTTLSRWA